MTNLYLSDMLSLPLDAATQTFGVLATRGAGKTYTGSVMAEEMLKNQLQVVVLDPLGAWWGLRSGADGKSEGLPIVILGGEHADIPIDETMGQRIAEIVAKEHLSCVIDVGEWNDSEQFRFMTAFAKTLYRLNRTPMHLFLEEADVFAPQKPMREQNHLLNAMKNILKRGRFRGIGTTLITQRAAAVNKDVLNMIQTLIVLRTIAPRDRNAVREWVEAKATSEQMGVFLDSLSSLKTGEAWFWSPEWLDVFERIQVRRRETYDSSATPKVGEVRADYALRGIGDLSWLHEALGVTESPELDVNDSAAQVLRLRIVELERQLAVAKTPVVEYVEVPVVSEEQERTFLESIDRLHEISESITTAVAQAAGHFVSRMPATFGTPEVTGILDTLKKYHDITDTQMDAIRRESRPVPNGNSDLSKSASNFLEVMLRRTPLRLTRNQWAVLAGYSTRSSSVPAAFKELADRGLVEEGQGGATITSVGIDLLGGEIPEPQSPAEVRAMWLAALGKSESTILGVMIDCYPSGLSKGEIADAARYSRTSSSVGAALSILRKQGLVTLDGHGYWRAADVLFT